MFEMTDVAAVLAVGISHRGELLNEAVREQCGRKG